MMHQSAFLCVRCCLVPVQFHASSTSHIGTVLSKDEHTVLCARASASPLFVMPLSKKAGSFQTLLLQWQPPNRLLFTTLDEFKQWGPQAPPHLTVQLFEDLKDSHGVVLARGDLVSSQLISAPEVCGAGWGHMHAAALRVMAADCCWARLRHQCQKLHSMSSACQTLA